MKDFTGKKLLILGGAYQHRKAVRAAKNLGATVYVADYIPDSPAKELADKSFLYDVKDIDGIVKMCRNEKIDGILNICLDACQRPYNEIAEALGLPCYGTADQFFKLTDKHAFKHLCRDNGVDTIPEYPVRDFSSPTRCKDVIYPVLVKPVDSRGSRGQSICNSYEETKTAIDFAKSETESGDVIIERRMDTTNDCCVTYFVINGEPILTRVGKRHLGSPDERMGSVSLFGSSPAPFIGKYIENVHPKIVNMIKNVGIKNGPVFMQGLIDGDTVRFYDPGLRFPGAGYEMMYAKIYGIDLLELLTEFAFTGEIDFDASKLDPTAGLLGKRAVYLLPAVRPGRISKITGMRRVRANPHVISVYQKYFEGDTVGEHYNVNQRFAEIDIICDTLDELKETITFIYNTLRVYDAKKNDMIFGKIDVDIIE